MFFMAENHYIGHHRLSSFWRLFDLAERHPEANVITRAIGASRNLYIDLDMHDVKAGDRYLVCSDGLYKEVAESEMAELVTTGTPEDACNALVELTLERGSRDNVSVIVIQAE